MDKERHDNAWDVKKALAKALVNFNDIRTNKEWIMDLKESNPPVNPLALPTYQKGDKPYVHKHTKDLPKGGKPTNGNKTKNWKYIGPKGGKSETKWITTADGKKEKCLWCNNKQCHHWTMSHTGHGARDANATKSKKPKAEDLKLQGSLKTFLSQATGKDVKLSKKESQKLQALLTTMSPAMQPLWTPSDSPGRQLVIDTG
jgi:hypothetical protein